MNCEVCGASNGLNRIFKGVPIVICEPCWKTYPPTTKPSPPPDETGKDNEDASAPKKPDVFTIWSDQTGHDPHTRGLSCDECWQGFPKPCTTSDCKGFLHASFGGEFSDGEYWLNTRCDTCGESK